MRLIDIQEILDPHGLLIHGAFEAEDGFIVLVGNAGSAFWPRFAQSAEYLDNQADPLDRWSRRLGDDVAKRFGARAIYPFDGPPYSPFQHWARKAGNVFASPVAVLIHPEYGLWHAYRFALALDRPPPDFSPSEDLVSPCESCADKPCLQACPVGAFDADSYDVAKCMDYLGADECSPCRELGCAARRACPVGNEYQYDPDHARFHMDAFVRSRLP